MSFVTRDLDSTRAIKLSVFIVRFVCQSILRITEIVPRIAFNRGLCLKVVSGTSQSGLAACVSVAGQITGISLKGVNSCKRLLTNVFQNQFGNAMRRKNITYPIITAKIGTGPV